MDIVIALCVVLLVPTEGVSLQIRGSESERSLSLLSSGGKIILSKV